MSLMPYRPRKVDVDRLRELATDPLMSQRAAARDLGITSCRVCYAAQRLGIPWIHARGWSRLDQDTVERLASDPSISSYEAARKLRVADVTLIRYCRERGIVWVRRNRFAYCTARNPLIAHLRNDHKLSLEQIGRVYFISRERVRQIVEQHEKGQPQEAGAK